MAVNLAKYVITANYTLPPGTLATVVAGEPGTGAPAGYGNSATATGQAGGLWSYTFQQGTPIILDNGTPSALYTALNTAGVLRAFVDGQDDVGHVGPGN